MQALCRGIGNLSFCGLTHDKFPTITSGQQPARRHCLEVTMTGLSSIWHRMPQSRAILARLEEAEFVRVKELAIPADRDAFHPLTDRAGRALDRLDALRSEATSKEIGF